MPLIPDSDLDLAFSPNLIPEAVRRELHADLHIRPLASTDHSRNHLAILRVLTKAPDVSPESYEAQFAEMKSCPNTYFPIVIISRSTDAIVGVGTVFLEKKFLRGLGTVGHVEDIAVDGAMQGKKIGLRIIQALVGISDGMGCYKTILNCNDGNIPFYEKCGFVKKENEMARYKPESSTLAQESTAVATAAPPAPAVEHPSA